jgi:hypothetical protein
MTKERITLRDAHNLALQVQRDTDERLMEERRREAERLEDPRIAELEAENAKLRADISHWIGVSEGIERDRDKLRAALEQVEWIFEDGAECAWCRARPVYGHKDDCARQSALSQGGGEE